MAYAKAEDRQRAGRAHYLANRQLYIDRARASKNRIRAKNRANLLEYLRTHPCVDCGEPDPIVLQFDHTGDDKSAGIARMVTEARAWGKILLEIAKCEVVCADCHARRTAKRHGGWFKALNGPVVELVDRPDSNLGALRRAGSNPARPTPMGYGVIGSPSGSGPGSLGSSPSTSAMPPRTVAARPS